MLDHNQTTMSAPAGAEPATPAPLCAILTTGQSSTPLEAFNWAARVKREFCDRILEPDPRVAIWLFEEGLSLNLRTELWDEEICTFYTSRQPDLSEWTEPLVVDMVDALHMCGIVIEALGATITDISGAEWGTDWRISDAYPDADWPMAQLLATADHSRRDPESPSSHDYDGRRLSSPVVLNRLEGFNRVADLASKVNRLGAGNPNGARQAENLNLYAARLEGGFVVCVNVELGPGGSPFMASFCSQGLFSGPFNTSVPDISYAVQMAFLLMKAIGLTSLTIGRRDQEDNKPLLHKPLAPGFYWGDMARADHQRQPPNSKR